MVEILKNSKKIEIYSIFIQTIISSEQRRQQISVVYYSILAAMSALLGSKIDINSKYVVFCISIISLIFFAKIRYFKKLASAKFSVIKQLESGWDIRPFEIEWVEFKKTQKIKVIGNLTQLESLIPLAISILGFVYVFSHWVVIFFINLTVSLF